MRRLWGCGSGTAAEIPAKFPEGFTELVIEGGCRAGFGLYGPQRGDGTPAISGAEHTPYSDAFQ